MAIPTPTIPSAINAVSAVRLSPTMNNRAFYVNSGVISANDTETTVLSINDVGKRDVLFCINPFIGTMSSDHVILRIKINGSEMYKNVYMDRYDTGPTNGIHLILPANVNIEITFQISDSTAHEVGVACYGYYMESM